MELRQPVVAGVSIALVGYTSAFAVVLAGLRAVGASPDQATSGLIALSAITGLGTIWLSLRHREPFTLAWSTPGAAVLAGSGAVTGEWSSAVGAFVVVGVLVLATGFWPALGAAVRAIPAPIAQAMLAGVVLQICLVPLAGLGAHPWQILPLVLTWLALVRVAPRWAVPAVFVALLVVAGTTGPGDVGDRFAVPRVTWTAPELDWSAVISLALPLYVVTMAAQNVPGVAILASFGYRVPWRESMTITGVGTALGAPLGGHAINLAAISAAVPASAEAHPDPARRWPAATAFGGSFLVLAVLTAPLTAFLAGTPAAVVGTVAALGLLGTLAAALSAAVEHEAGRVPATVTLVVAASGVTVGGVGAAFWALVCGVVVHAVLQARPPARRTARSTSAD